MPILLCKGLELQQSGIDESRQQHMREMAHEAGKEVLEGIEKR